MAKTEVTTKTTTTTTFTLDSDELESLLVDHFAQKAREACHGAGMAQSDVAFDIGPGGYFRGVTVKIVAVLEI